MREHGGRMTGLVARSPGSQDPGLSPYCLYDCDQVTQLLWIPHLDEFSQFPYDPLSLYILNYLVILVVINKSLLY